MGHLQYVSDYTGNMSMDGYWEMNNLKWFKADVSAQGTGSDN